MEPAKKNDTGCVLEPDKVSTVGVPTPPCLMDGRAGRLIHVSHVSAVCVKTDDWLIQESFQVSERLCVVTVTRTLTGRPVVWLCIYGTPSGLCGITDQRRNHCSVWGFIPKSAATMQWIRTIYYFIIICVWWPISEMKVSYEMLTHQPPHCSMHTIHCCLVPASTQTEKKSLSQLLTVACRPWANQDLIEVNTGVIKGFFL